MAKKRIALELGQGTSIRSMDYTSACVRAVKDALWRNSLSVADAFGFDRDDMIVDVELGVQQPDAVDVAQVAKVFPYGKVTVTPTFGGLDAPKRGTAGHTVVAVAAIIVSFDFDLPDEISSNSAGHPEPVEGGHDTLSAATLRQAQDDLNSAPELKRIILKIGTGNDLYGQDYTKAANRAVQDAIHHSSILLFKTLNLDPTQMIVDVTIAVAQPELVDCAAVASTLPRGRAQVRAIKGGLNVYHPETGETSVIAVASVEALYPIDPSDWRRANHG